MEKYQNDGLNLSTKVINIFYGHGKYYFLKKVSTYLKKNNVLQKRHIFRNISEIIWIIEEIFERFNKILNT